MSLTDAIAPPNAARAGPAPALRARRLGIDTLDETVLFLRRDCPVCRSEGFESRAMVRVRHGAREIVATLYQVTDHLLGPDEAGLSDAAWTRLGLTDGARIEIAPRAPSPRLPAPPTPWRC